MLRLRDSTAGPKAFDLGGRSIGAVRTELIPAPPVDALDPTGCGDVFGAAMMSRLLAGDGRQSATREATGLAARNAMLRGASDSGAAAPRKVGHCFRHELGMSRVVEIPAFFDDKGFEQFAHSFSAGPITDRMLFDARGAQWASPYGLIGMLTAGQAVKEAGGPPPAFAVPEPPTRSGATGCERDSSVTPPSCSSFTARCRR